MRKQAHSLIVYLPTSLFTLVMVVVLLHNGCSVFYVSLSFPSRRPNLGPPSDKPAKESQSTASLAMLVMKEEPPSVPSTNRSSPRSTTFKRSKAKLRVAKLGQTSKHFSKRITTFFRKCHCRGHFFMTWIDSLSLFDKREVFAMESLFKTHPNACLVIVSNSMDSDKGRRILSPFLRKGYRVIACKPDFDSLFKGTHARLWFEKLKRGRVNPGAVSLGQNVSNLLRLALLYKFGGIYLDTDVVVLKNLLKLRNAIGAQTMDFESGQWTRLNNAVLVFDKSHPLLFKFIQEFALTFDGSKWGHNGPYLVSRVVSRVIGRKGFENVTVLPPNAFYPVNWRSVGGIFREPRDRIQSEWLKHKMKQIKDESFTIHLWNKQSKLLRIEEASFVARIMLEYCLFCNSSNFYY